MAHVFLRSPRLTECAQNIDFKDVLERELEQEVLARMDKFQRPF